MNKKEVVDKSGTPSSWIIKDTNDKRLEDMRKDFKDAFLLKPIKSY